MPKKKKIIIISSVVSVLVLIAIICTYMYFTFTQGKVVPEEEAYYLFCYFTGNEPEKERVRFAVSDDGYNFSPLNNNEAIITQTKGTLSMRDPYIFRANNKYYIIATDMRSELGWNSNHAMVIWESEDLITWGNERIIDIAEHEGFENSCRVWAPQVFHDLVEDKYMVYWSNCIRDVWDTYIVYAYLNDDFTDVGEIKTLYNPASGKDVIDGDIICESGTFYLYYKDENASRICYAYSNKLTGPYIEPEQPKVSTSFKDVEGSCMYRLNGTDTYLMIMDEYSDHNYYMQATTADSMTDFVRVRKSEYSFDFSPRHGSMLNITKTEYDRLCNAKWN